jgi:YfiH family protein
MRALATASNGVPLLRAPTLQGDEAMHGFTTRIGGVSASPFATLNLGRGVGDVPERVEANRRRVMEALGCDPAGQVEASQVHGREVAVVTRTERGTKIDGADALVTADRGVVLAIHAADCVPILLWDPRRGAVGAVHAGWRGTAAGVAAAAVETMIKTFGTDPRDLRVGMGPAIGPCHYEVDDPVASAFALWSWSEAVLLSGDPGRWHLDLVDANRRMLEALGVPPGQIWVSGLCTACHPDRFFSYRREGVTGRMGALISLG